MARRFFGAVTVTLFVLVLLNVVAASGIVGWVAELLKTHPSMMSATVSQGDLGIVLLFWAEAQLKLGEKTKDSWESFGGFVLALFGLYLIVTWFFGW